MLSLIKRIHEPDKQALFVEMLETHKEQFYRIAYSYAKNEHDALDIIQDSVCKAYASLDKLKELDYMKTWFTRIVINTAITLLNRNRRVSPIDDAYLQTEIDESTSSTDKQTAEKMDLMQALSHLNEKEKAIVVLRYFEDYKLEDVSRAVDTPLNTTKTILYRALKKMKINLEEAYAND